MATHENLISQENIKSSELDKNLLPKGKDPIDELVSEFGNIPVVTTEQIGQTFDKSLTGSGLLTDDFTDAEIELLNHELDRVNVDREYIDNLKAQNQSGFGNLFYRGPVRTLAKVPQELLKGAGTLVGGAAWFLSGADKKDMSLIFDNAFNKGVDKVFNYLFFENETLGLKVHIPTKVKEGNLVDNLKSSAFWASEGADAVGFFASMLVPGAAIKGLGVGAKIANGLNKITKPLTKLNRLARGSVNSIDDILAASINTIIESGAEASGTYQNLTQQLLNKGYSANEANEIASDKAASVFNTNLGLLIGPNLMMNKFLFGKLKPSSKVLQDIIKQPGKQFASLKLGKEIVKKSSVGFLSEGFFEEGFQSATEQYFTEQGLKGVKDEKTVNEEIKSIFSDMSGIIDTYVTELPKNIGMQKAIFLGGLLGGLGGSIGAYRGYKNTQNEYFGKEASNSRIKKSLAKTKLGKLIVGDLEQRRGLKDIMNNSLLTNFTSLEEVIEKDDKGEPIFDPETNFYKINKEKLGLLGKDISKSLGLVKMIREAEIANDTEAFEKYKDEGIFDYFKPMLRSVEGVRVLKDEIIPQKAKELANRINTYQAELSEEEIRELDEGEINVEASKLIKKVDSFKEIYDGIEENHNFDMNVDFKAEDSQTYNLFSENIKLAKLEKLVNINTASERINYFNNLNSKLEQKVDKAETPISKLSVGDIIEYKGKKVMALGDDKYTEIDDLRAEGKSFKFDKNEDKKVLKYNLNESEITQYIRNKDKINYNSKLKIESEKDLKKLYNDGSLQSLYNDQLKQKKDTEDLIEFNKTFTDNSDWVDQEGNKHRLKKIDDKLRLYEETVDEEGLSQYTKEVEDEDVYSNKDKFLEKYTKLENIDPITEEIIPEIEEDIPTDTITNQPKEQPTDKTNNILEDIEQLIELGATKAIIEYVNNIKDNEIKGDLNELKNSLNKRLGQDIFEVDQIDPIPNSTTNDFDESEKPNSPEENDSIELDNSGLKRSIFNLFNGTAGNLKQGLDEEEYNHDPNMVKAQSISDKYNLAAGKYQIKVVKASSTFPNDYEYFKKNAEPLGYDWNNVYYSILVDKDGKYVTEKDNQLIKLDISNLDSQKGVKEKDIIYWSLRLSDTQYKYKTADGKIGTYDAYYKPQGLNGYKKLFPNVELNTLKEYEEYFQNSLNTETDNYSNIRTNIANNISRGEDVIIPIVGKSFGVENATKKEKAEAEYVEALTRIAEIEKVTKSELLETSRLVNATGNVTRFEDGNRLNTVPGAMYLHIPKTGRVYRMDTRQLQKSEIDQSIDLLKVYISNINKFQSIEEAKILRHTVEEEELKLTDSKGEGISVWRALSNIFYMKSPDSKSFDSSKDIYLQGKNSIVVGGVVEGISGNTSEKYKIALKQDDGEFILNPRLIEALQKVLPLKYHQVNRLKLEKKEDHFNLKNIDTITGNVVGDFTNYKNYLLENVLQTKFLIPVDTAVTNVDETFGGGTKNITPPVNSNVYQILDYSDYKDNLNEPSITPSIQPEIISDLETKISHDTIENEDEDDYEDFSGIEDAPFRAVIEDVNVERENIEDIQKWYKENMPSELPLNIMRNLIAKGLYGAMYKSAVYLDTNAELGTGYHEAFHAISHLVLPPTQQQKLYKEYRDQNPETTLSDKEIEEVLAEEFRDFMLLNGAAKIKSSVKKNIFTRLFNWIKTIIGNWSGNLTKEQVFDRISSGKYANESIRPSSVFSPRVVTDFETGQPEYDNPRFVSNVINSVNYLFFDYIRDSENGLGSFFNKSNNSDIILDAYKNIRAKISEKYKEENLQYQFYKNLELSRPLNKSEIIQSNKAIRKGKIYLTILENIDNGKVQQHHEIKLKEYGLDRILDEEAVKENLDEHLLGKDSGWDIADRSIKFSAKENASKAIKLLLGTLPAAVYDSTDKDKPYRRKLNALGLPYSTNFNKVFASLISKMSGAKTIPSVMNILEEFRPELPSLQYLWNSKGLDFSSIKSGNINQMPIERFNEIIQFVQTFGKTENNFSNDLVLENGERKFTDSNLSIRRKTIKEKWASESIRSSIDDKYPNHKHYNTENNTYKTNSFRGINLETGTDQEALNFLRSIGVEFTLNRAELDSKGVLAEIIKRANFILKDINSKVNAKPNIFSINIETNSGQDLVKLIDIEYNTTVDNVENSHIGIDGETVYNHSLNYYVSLIIDNINEFNSLESLHKFYPHLNPKNTKYLRNSMLLKKGGILFDDNGKKRLDSDITIKTVDGIVEDNSGKTTSYSKLTPPERMSSVMSRTLENDYNLFRPADKSLERFLHIPNTINIKERNKIFKNYLKDELLRSKEEAFKISTDDVWNNKNKKFKDGILINIISKYGSTALKNNLNSFLNKSESNLSIEVEVDNFINSLADSENGNDHIGQALNDYFTSRSEILLDWLIQNRILDSIKSETGEIIYENNGLTSKLDGEVPSKFNRKDINQILSEFIFKDTMFNIEQTKLIFGDPIFFSKVSDIFKRTGSYVGTKKLSITDEIIDKYIEDNLKRVDGAEGLVDNRAGAQLKNNQSDIVRYKPIIKQLVIDDVLVRERLTNDLKKFAKVLGTSYSEIAEEADGFSWTTLDETRELNFRAGDWGFNENSMEEAYQWQMQNYYGNNPNILPEGRFKELFGHEWDNSTKKVYNPHTGEEITKQPAKVWNLDKPLYVGPYAEKGFNPGITKTSFGKLIPSMVDMKDKTGKLMFPNLKSTMDYMTKNQIGVLSFYSANKGASTKLNSDGSFNQLYDKNGNLNLENSGVIQHTYYEFWGMQLDTGNNTKSKTISGTQQAKQVVNGIKSQGKIKEELKHLEPLIEELFSLNSERLNVGKRELLESLEIFEDEDGNWKIKNYSRFKESLADIARTRGMSNNVLNAIDYIDEDLGMDILINKDKFEPVIYSLNDAMVIKQKRNGGQFYQVASTLFENNSQRKIADVINNKPVYESSDLEFYQPKEGELTTRMGIYIADKYKGTPIEELKGSDLIKAIGFRIPTQGPNSIEAVYIKGFLPKEVGDIVVLPSSIVAKAGSDYDIDKLSIYLSNFYYDENNKPVYIKNSDNISADWAKYIDIQYIRMVNNITNTLSKNVDTIKNKFKEYKQELIKNDNLTIEGFIEKFENFNNSLDTDSLNFVKEEVNYVLEELNNVDEETDYSYIAEDQYLKQSIENRMSEIQGEILLDKANSENFLSPLDSDLIGKLADKIYKARTGLDRNVNSLSNIVDRIFLVQTAERFLSAKEAVGITALASTFHIMSQLYDVQVEDTMALPHNQKDNNISVGALETVNGESIIQMLSLWISAAVDGAKDPKMFDLNVNLETLNVVLYLTMAGVPTENLMSFINQPIIIEYIGEQIKNQSHLMTNSKYNVETESGNYTANKYKSNQQIQKELKTKYKNNFDNDTQLTQKLLGQYVGKNPKKDSIFNKIQVTVLNEYLKHKKTADLLADAVQGISYDTNSAGKNSVEMLMRLFKTKKVLENDKLINYDKILKSSDTNAFMEPYYNNVKDLKTQFEPLFKVSLGDPNLRNMIETILEVYNIDGNFISQKDLIKTLDKLNNAYFSYHLVNKEYDVDIIELTKENAQILKDTKKLKIKDQVAKLFEGKGSVAKQLNNIQSILKDFNNAKTRDSQFKEMILSKYGKKGIQTIHNQVKSYKAILNVYNKYKDNELLRSLIPVISTDSTQHYDYVILHNKKLDLIQTNELTLNWETILNDSNSLTANFGLNLIKLLAIQGGVQPSPINFMKLVPAEVYSKLLKSTMKNRKIDDLEAANDAEEFFTLFMLDNFNDDKILPGKNVRGLPFRKTYKEFKDEYIGNSEKIKRDRGFGINTRKPINPIYTSGENGVRLNDLLPTKFEKDFKNNRAINLYALVNNLSGKIKNKADMIILNSPAKNLSELNVEHSVGKQASFKTISYSNYADKTGSNIGDTKITPEEWAKLNDDQRSKAIDCK